jgi:flagellin-like hook-associated protein FlgL
MSNLISSLSTTLSSAVNSVQKEIVDTQKQLASGIKILNSADIGIVTRLSAQAAGYKSVTQNIAAANNVINVAQTALSSITTILSQMKDIATQAANAGLTSGVGSDRAALDTTFVQLRGQVDSLITNAGVNGENVLTLAATSNLTIQTGITGLAPSQTAIAGLAMTLTSLGINASTVGSDVNARSAITALTAALTTVSTSQSVLSATKTGLEASAAASLSLSTNLQATVDSIQNIDETALQARLQQLNNQQSIDYYLISQMNTAAAAALAIFR